MLKEWNIPYVTWNVIWLIASMLFETHGFETAAECKRKKTLFYLLISVSLKNHTFQSNKYSYIGTVNWSVTYSVIFRQQSITLSFYFKQYTRVSCEILKKKNT